MPRAVVFDERSFYALKRQMEVSRLEAANLRNRLSRLEGGSRGSYIPWSRRIPFRNDSGETVPRWGVMRITGGSAEEYLTIAKPSTTFGRLYAVNLDTDILSNGFGLCTLLTAESLHFADNYVLYDTGNTPAYGESWGPQNGTWTLKKFRYGFTIMGGNTGSGSTARTIAVQHPVNHFYGQTDAAITKGSSGTISVYDGANADTSINVSSVENKFADVAISKKVSVSWEAGVWRLTAAEDVAAAVEIYRGVTDAAINKGSSGTVSRYNAAGSDTGTNDTVTNLFVDVAISKKVVYVKVESTFFMIAAECPLT